MDDSDSSVSEFSGLSDGLGDSSGANQQFLVREEDEKKNYKIKLAIKRMYTAVKG